MVVVSARGDEDKAAGRVLRRGWHEERAGVLPSLSHL